ncbi:MAG: AMP-binding protein [Actinobacteria bacterium]|uniref:Unannotated protein n=3 Tax=freshwater metagenome TaxID=449393 RepID=A0A6J7R3E9_9ZZZZ|nr:AMP-binding protein [Actinomycetota bacterium]
MSNDVTRAPFIRPRSRTLSDLLGELAERRGDATAVVHADGATTFGALHTRALAVATALRSLGVRRGDRVGLLMSNRIEWLETLFGAAEVGATVHAINTWVAPREFELLVEEADCAVLVLMASHGRRRFVDDLLATVPDIASAAPGSWQSARFPSLRAVVMLDDGLDSPDARPRGVIPYPDWVTQGLADGPVPGDEGLESAAAAAVVLYTSGSTARPKAVPLLHHGMIENGFNIGGRLGLTEQDRVWLSSPLFWSFGCANALMATFTHGATLVLQEQFDVTAAIDVIEREACTAAYLLPTLIYALHEKLGSDSSRIRSLRTGAMIGSADDLLMAAQDLGIEGICNVYGATEVYGNCCVTPHDMALEHRSHGQGPPLPGVTVRIVDPETRTPLSTGDVGEIEVTGYVTPGYLGDHARTSFTADGYYKTGDLGYLDDHGWIHFAARASDIIKTSGINVAPADVEEFLVTHDSVDQVAVVGATDRLKGEIVVAFVVPRPGATIDADALITYCRTGLASYKVPARIIVVDELAKTDTGKLSRRALRDSAENTTTKKGT